MEITKKHIPHIEKALGITLHKHQVEYLLKGTGLDYRRRSGKTLVYCIMLSLSDGPDLDLRTPEDYSDMQLLPNRIEYARGFFRYEFLRIRRQLKDYGFPVRGCVL